MKKRFFSLLLCFCICLPLLTVAVSAAANKIDVSAASYYDGSGDVESLTINFGWDTASANSRLTVMTTRLRSAGEAGTNKSYGDFTDYGYYGTSFKNWEAVLSKSDTFGILYYTDEQKITSGKTNTFSVGFDEGDIPLDVDQTYYLYLWTYYGGYYYPDNLFMVLQVKDGKFQYASATGRNSYGNFTTLRETANTPAQGNTQESAGTIAAPNFTDVKSDAYYAVPVSWAVSKGITNGTSATTFSPEDTCTRAQILTFLWRAAGSPEPRVYTSFSPYYDVKMTDYFFKPAAWAAESGITDIQGAYFNPNTPCTRAATVEYFWRFAGSPSVAPLSFSDLGSSENLQKAVAWAVTYGITNGTGGTTFSPNGTCTRGQIVTFLHRYFVFPLDNSSFIASLTKPTGTTPPATGNMQLDPLPPVDYMKQPDWYGTLTPAHTMSNARLVAEYEQITKVIADRKAQGIYMSDGPYSRELDLWSELSQRCDVVVRYDRGVRNGSPSDWVVEAYNELVAAYGDADPLRQSSEYDG